MKYRFHITCIDSKAELIDCMTEQSKQITWRTFLKYVDFREVRKIFYWYTYYGKGLHLKDDFTVSFHKSKYDGKPCVYVDHSRIEYIFLGR